jgi:hypothetical protein
MKSLLSLIIGKIMKTHVINSSADKVYEAAKTEFEGMYVPLSDSGKLTGSTQWPTRPVTLGSKKYSEKDRFVVVVNPEGSDKSRVTVTRELQSNFSGDWPKVN